MRAKDAVTHNAMVKEDGIERGLDALFTEAARAERFGFTATELERQKLDTLRSLERAAAEKDKQQSAALASEYVRHATQGDPPRASSSSTRSTGGSCPRSRWPKSTLSGRAGRTPPAATASSS